MPWGSGGSEYERGRGSTRGGEYSVGEGMEEGSLSRSACSEAVKLDFNWLFRRGGGSFLFAEM